MIGISQKLTNGHLTITKTLWILGIQSPHGLMTITQYHGPKNPSSATFFSGKFMCPIPKKNGDWVVMLEERVSCIFFSWIGVDNGYLIETYCGWLRNPAPPFQDGWNPNKIVGCLPPSSGDNRISLAHPQWTSRTSPWIPVSMLIHRNSL